MPDELDDFVCDYTAEEFYDDYRYDYDYHETWYDVESAFCEELEIEPEVYED